MTETDPATARGAKPSARPASLGRPSLDRPSPAETLAARSAKLPDLLYPKRPGSPRLGTLLIVIGLTEGAQALMRSGVEVANRLGAHLLCLSCSPYVDGEASGSAEGRAARRLLEIEGERFEALSASVRAGGTWLSSTRAMTPSLGALSWWADLLMLNADELGEGRGAWRRLGVLSSALATPILVRPMGEEPPDCDSVVLVSEASTASQQSIRRALPLILKARHVQILANDGSGDRLKSGLLARGLKASCVELKRSEPYRRPETSLADEARRVVVHGGALAHRSRFAIGELRRPSVSEYRSALLV